MNLRTAFTAAVLDQERQDLIARRQRGLPGLVDQVRGLLGNRFVLGHRTSEEHFTLLLTVGKRPEPLG